MTKQAEYVAGWIDTSIHAFLAGIDDPSSSMSYTLITCLDSCFDMPTLLQKSKHLAPLKDKCELVGNNLLVSTRQLLAAERRQRIFFGFDEIWFFPDGESEAKPNDFILVGSEKRHGGVSDNFARWMHDNRCSLGLGDGIGMTFCLRARGAARYIVRAFNNTATEEQPSERESA